MVCVPCIVIPFLLWFFHRYLRPIMEKLCPSMLKYLPGNSPKEQEESGGKCPFNSTQSAEKDSTDTKTEVTAGDGGTKKTN